MLLLETTLNCSCGSLASSVSDDFPVLVSNDVLKAFVTVEFLVIAEGELLISKNA